MKTENEKESDVWAVSVPEQIQQQMSNENKRKIFERNVKI